MPRNRSAASAVLQANGLATLTPGKASITKASSGSNPTAAKARNVDKAGAAAGSDRGEPVFTRHHHLDQASPVGGDRLGSGVEQFAGQAVAGEQQAHLLAFASGHELDVTLLFLAGCAATDAPRSGCREVGDRHAEPVGGEVGRTEHEYDRCLEPDAGDTGHHGVGRDSSVDRPVHHVAEVARLGGSARRGAIAPGR